MLYQNNEDEATVGSSICRRGEEREVLQTVRFILGGRRVDYGTSIVGWTELILLEMVYRSNGDRIWLKDDQTMGRNEAVVRVQGQLEMI